MYAKKKVSAPSQSSRVAVGSKKRGAVMRNGLGGHAGGGFGGGFGGAMGGGKKGGYHRKGVR
jgi:hypothetical protein